MKPMHQRLIFVVMSVVFLCGAVLLALQALRENIVYFYSPSEIAEEPPAAGRKIRVGGLVKNDSIVQLPEQYYEFIVSDGAQEVRVRYVGQLPALFRQGQGVVAEGVMQEDGWFAARTILAKHDEKYMPKEVVDALKKSGHWKQ